MDKQKKRLSAELDKLVQNHQSSQAHIAESSHLPGILNSSKNNTSVATPKREHIKDSSDIASSQAHPKKKGGFVITSVKDNVDGDESADDLDESHASYSDVSYSRATDIDHDQESTASEDTLNLTVQDAGQPPADLNQNHAANSSHNIGQATASNDQAKQHLPASHVTANASTYRPKSERTQSRSTSLDMSQDSSNDASPDTKQSQVTNVVPAQGTGVGTVAGISSSQSSHAQESQQTPHPKPTANNSKASNISPSSISVSTVSSAPSVSSSSTSAKGTSSNSTLPKGGSRVYKVVKRDTGPPVGRDVARWHCYDYGDGQTPNLGFVAQSASDSRLSFQDQLHLQPANQLASSMSTTSVPSSSSSYSLQHSDSTSSVHRDGYPHGMSIGLNSAVQHSASTSSVNPDLEARKLLRSMKGAVSEIFNADSRLSGTSTAEQELLKNVMQSSGELAANPEQDDDRGKDTKSTGRIDNKIGTAMDLVKMHLMSAVRDEVGELKEKIVELTAQNEALLGILHPEQIAALQPQQTFLTSGQSLPFQVKAASQSQQVPLYQQPPAGITSPIATVDLANPPPLSLASTGNQVLGQKPPHSLNPAGFSVPNQPGSLQRGQTGQPQQNQTIPVLQNQAGGLPSAIGHPQQPLPGQQQLLQTQQQVLSQLTRPANYQQNQQIFPPTIQPVPPQHQQQFLGNNSQQQSSQSVPLTPQQMQALLHVAYQQVSGQIPPQPSQISQGFQPSPLVMQQSGIQSHGQQAPLQQAPYQSYQPQVPLQQSNLFQTNPLPQATTPISQAQNQFQASQQQNSARTSVQSSQSATVLPRHQPQPSAPTNQNPPHSSLHGAVPNTLPDQHQQLTAVQTTNATPVHSGPSQSSNEVVAAEQKPPQS